MDPCKEFSAAPSLGQLRKLAVVDLWRVIELKLRLNSDMRVKIELEKRHLGQPRNEGVVGGRRPDNIGDMVRLLPKFNEKDPDVFFSLFESLAEERGWSDADRTSLIQSVLPSSSRRLPSTVICRKRVYATVKLAILWAYELCAKSFSVMFQDFYGLCAVGV